MKEHQDESSTVQWKGKRRCRSLAVRKKHKGIRGLSQFDMNDHLLPSYQQMLVEKLLAERKTLLDNLNRAEKKLTEEREERKRIEEQLADASTKLTTILDSFPDLFFHFEKDGTLLEIWPKASNDFYAPRKEQIGKSVKEILPVSVADKFCATLAHMNERSAIHTFFYTLPIQGVEQNYEARIVPLKNDEAIGFVRNITEETQSKATLHRKNNYLFALNQTALEVLKRREPNEIMLSLLKRAVTLLGAAQGVIAVKSNGNANISIEARVFSNKNDSSIEMGIVYKHLASNEKKQHFHVTKTYYEGRYYLLAPLKIGSSKKRGLIAVVFPTDQRQPGLEESEIFSFLANMGSIAIDNAQLYADIRKELKERRHIEKTLRKSEENQRALLNAIPDVVMRISKKGQIIDCSIPQDFTVSETINTGQHIYHFVPPGRREYYNKRIKKLIKTGAPQIVEYDVTVSGEKRRREARLVRAGNQEVVMIIRDVTENRRLEEQMRRLQKVEVLGTLAGGIAHDFNNILSVILGNAEMTIESPLCQKKILHYQSQIVRMGLYGRELIQRLLTFSRRGISEKKFVAFPKLIHECVDLSRMLLNTNIEVKVTNQLPAEARAYVDPVQIQQLMVNLCSNAEYAMRSRGGLLEIGLSQATVDEILSEGLHIKPGNYFSLSVKDDGIGMDRWVKERVFDPFFTTKQAGEGSGLGLSVVHGIVLEHGGAITVEAEIGKGTHFSIYIPAVSNTEDGKQEKRVENDCMSTESSKKITILFVDDEPMLVDLHKQLLESMGYSVVTCFDAIEALELIRLSPNQFDLVITDQAMPGMTGDVFVREALKIVPQMPFIMCTGYLYATNIEQTAQIRGIKEQLTKPLLKSELENAIQRVLHEGSRKE
ncbi:response regulator [Heliobacterium gestii]|uniref:Stage 0 sporulation protein A homolog n=1 Tax=Heliomicrobium gestii TaxID=2699 RepID=A0A845LFP9_HELGE|nr:ATP-binding protein [Heliomicrobium gestii]MBM7867924.1 signal transduction histidine kinase/ActR/RegA family two-component response regulator [Heliomicrobium gestii]MZP43265.1 response regulator [Heliomicrobium gestii]